MPGPSSGVPMNSIPAASNVVLIASKLVSVLEGTLSLASIRFIVRTLTVLNRDSCSTLSFRACLADLICDAVNIDKLLFWRYLCHMAHYYIKERTETIYDWRTELKRLDGAYAPATLKSYRADIEIFENWCQSQNIKPFPANVEAVCRFLEEQAPGKAPSTVRRRLYAIRKAHRLLRLPDPTYDEDINITLRRVRRAKHARLKQAKGLTKKYLEAFLDVQPDGPVGLRNKAMLALGYELLTRRAELVALNTDDAEFRDDGTLRVLIRRSKADPFGEGRLAFTSTKTARYVRDWLDWRGPYIRPLFCPIYQGKALQRSLSSTTVKALIKNSAMAIGLERSEVDRFSGHSLRVGAAQDLLCAGFDTAAIMRAGGWKSVNVLSRYLEKAEHNVWDSKN
jgi:integrase/recombinase XerD